MTGSSSIKAISRISAPQWGQSMGSTSKTFWIKRAQETLAARENHCLTLARNVAESRCNYLRNATRF